MAQDLRDLMAAEKEKSYCLKQGHEGRFAKRLDQELPRSRSRAMIYWSAAASLLMIAALGYYLLATLKSRDIPDSGAVQSGTEVRTGISLGDLSPDLKKVEQYYVGNINMHLAGLQVSAENKVVVDNFMERLGALNEEYELLNKELNEIGPNDQTIAALINNLQLRLELLYKLESKLKQLNASKNESELSNSI